MYCNKNCCTPCNDAKPNDLARACVPFQPFQNILGLKEGLIKGTIFGDLFKPYDPIKWEKTKKC